MAKFHIEIYNERILHIPFSQWMIVVGEIGRKVKGIDMVVYMTPSRDSLTFKGEAPIEIVSLLQAIARGDNLQVILDKLDI